MPIRADNVRLYISFFLFLSFSFIHSSVSLAFLLCVSVLFVFVLSAFYLYEFFRSAFSLWILSLSLSVFFVSVLLSLSLYSSSRYSFTNILNLSVPLSSRFICLNWVHPSLSMYFILQSLVFSFSAFSKFLTYPLSCSIIFSFSTNPLLPSLFLCTHSDSISHSVYPMIFSFLIILSSCCNHFI